jgi:RNA recognition motif-containing protein
MIVGTHSSERDFMSAHVYVEGLPTSATEEDLTTLFSECGTVLSVQIARTEDGIAEVQMARAEEAEQVIHDRHYVRLHGQLLLVC